MTRRATTRQYPRIIPVGRRSCQMSDTPDTDRRARLQALLHAQIQARGGRLPFRDYMEAALYAPGLGYYASGAVSLGRSGDFVTSPEVDPAFGRLLARWMGQV